MCASVFQTQAQQRAAAEEDCVFVSLSASHDSPIIPRCTPVTWTITVQNVCSSTETNLKVRFLYDLASHFSASGTNFTYTGPVNVPGGTLESLTSNVFVLYGNSSTTFQVTTTMNSFSVGNVFAEVFQGSDLQNVTDENILGDNLWKVIEGNVTVSSLLAQGSNSPLWSVSQACTQSSSSTQRIYIDGNLEIDQNYCFIGAGSSGLQRSAIVFAPGASITVTNGSLLRLKYADLYGCEKMFKGIIVEDGDINIDRVNYNDAQYAVQLKNNSSATITTSNFRDNYVGLHVPFQSGSPQNITINNFYRNTFEGTGNMKPPYSGQSPNPGFQPRAGVLAYNVSSLSLNAPSYSWRNIFRNMDKGVEVSSVNLTVIRADFEDLNTGIYAIGNGHSLIQEGFGSNSFSSSSFEDCNVGIAGQRYNLDISNNNMRTVNIGISLSQGQNRTIDIYDNFIDARDIGINSYVNTPLQGSIRENVIQVSDPGDENRSYGIKLNEFSASPNNGWEIEGNWIVQSRATYGIYNNGGDYGKIMNNTMEWANNLWEPYRGLSLIQSNNVNVSCNQVIGNAQIGGGTYIYKLGIGIDVKSAPANTLSCNLVDDTRYGVSVEGLSQMPGAFRGNEMGECYNGLILGNSSSGDAFLGIQSHEGNTWTGTYDSFTGAKGAVHQSNNPSNVDQSRFIVNANIPKALPTWSAVSSDWFIDQTGTTFTCGSNECPDGIGYSGLTGGGGTSSTYYKVADGSLETDQNNATYLYTGASQLYEMMNDGADFSDPVFAEFYNANGETPVGRFQQVKNRIRTNFDPQSEEIQGIQVLSAQIQANLREIMLIDSILSVNPDIPQANGLLQQRQARINQINSFEQTRDMLANEIHNEQIAEVIDISAENETIFEDEIFVHNQRLVNTAYLSLMVGEDLSFSEEEIVTLEGVAWQCPWSGGDAVFQARALLSLEQDNFYDDDLLCVQPMAFKQEEGTLAQSGLSIFPNPADEWITIQIGKGLANKLEVYNQIGQLMELRVLDEAVQNLEIHTKKWTSGVYYARLQLENGSTMTETFIINR